MSLQRLYQLDQSFAVQLDKVLHDEDYIKKLLKLPSNELVELVNYLNDTITRLDRTGGQSRKCLHVLRKICSTRKVLPDIYDVSKTLSVSTIDPFAYGGFCDAHRGHLNLREEVFIKRLRVNTSCDSEKIEKQLCEEAIVWKRANHPNIVPFRGVTLKPLQLVSQWMPGGNLREHIGNNKNANLIDLLLDIANGLAYLHSCGLVHGDLKGPNVVLDASGHARITDFGLASIVRDPSSVESNPDVAGYSARWSAPEVFYAGAIASKKSDVFSFAMVIFEVYSGAVPFQPLRSSAVPAHIMLGERPSRPAHPDLNDRLWELTQRCWKENVKDRPEMEEVHKELVAIKNAPPQPAPPNKPQVTTVGSGRRPGSAQDAPPKKNTNENKGTGVTPYDMNPIQPVTKPPTPKLEVEGPPAPKEIVPGREIVGPSSGPPHIPVKDALEVEETTKKKGTPGDKPPKPSGSTTTVNTVTNVNPTYQPTQGPRSHYGDAPTNNRPSLEKPPPPPSHVVNSDEGTELTARPLNKVKGHKSKDQMSTPSASRPPDRTQGGRPTGDQNSQSPGQPPPQNRDKTTGGQILSLQLPTPPPAVTPMAEMPKQKKFCCF